MVKQGQRYDFLLITLFNAAHAPVDHDGHLGGLRLGCVHPKASPLKNIQISLRL